MAKPIYLIKQAADPGCMDLYIYDNVQGDSTDWWTGETTESQTSANYIKSQLECCPNCTQINIYINSYGGDVKEGLAIYNQLKRNPAQKTVYIDGFACSIASVIAMAGDKVIMGPNTLMMIHHASMTAWGNSDELRKAANDLDVIDKASCSSYLAKAGDKLTEDLLNQLLDNQTWLNAEQCIQYGLADLIAGQEEDKMVMEAKQRFKKSVQLEIEQHATNIKVPENLITQKTNAEKMMAAFIKNNLGGK